MEDDWEQAAEMSKVVPPKNPNINKWEGEDEDDDVKDSWEDEEEKKDEEKFETKMVKSKPKKSLQEKIAEKERIMQEEIERKERVKEESMSPEEKLAEKLKIQKLQEEADLKTAMETFGVTDKINDGIDNIIPTNKAEFSILAEAISKKIALYKNNEDFPGFLEELIRDVCVNLNSLDLKKVKTTIDNLYVEKQKLEKEKSKKGKSKTKAKLRIEGDNASINEYGYADYDYDDFM